MQAPVKKVYGELTKLGSGIAGRTAPEADSLAAEVSPPHPPTGASGDTSLTAAEAAVATAVAGEAGPAPATTAKAPTSTRIMDAGVSADLRVAGTAGLSGTAGDPGATAAAVAAEEAADVAELARYRQLQQSIARLQGLQIPSQKAQARRCAEALQLQLETAHRLVEERRKGEDLAVMAAGMIVSLIWDWAGGDEELLESQLAKFASNQWYLGKLVTGKRRHQERLVASRERLGEATGELAQEKQLVAELEGRLEEVKRRLAAWQAKVKEAELAADQRDADELEERLFGRGASRRNSASLTEEDEGEEERDTANEEAADLVDDFLGSEEEEEGEGGRGGAAGGGRTAGLQQPSRPPPPGAPSAPTHWGDLPTRAPQPGPAADPYGRYFRGRLVRLAAHKLKQTLSFKRAEPGPGPRHNRQELLSHVAGSIGVHGPLRKAQDFKQDFPDAANKFNPMLHCPPSTFLWPYSSKFMGKLQRLQTGPVLQAFYRFGPFDFDPEDLGSPVAASGPNSPCSPPGHTSTTSGGTAHGTDAGSADDIDEGEGSRGSSGAGASSAATAGAGGSLGGRPRPLVLLPGLGATMIAWGVPLLRALACSHEVIIMEYRGAGLSKDSSGEPWNYYRQAEAVLMLTDALEIQQPDILGWSSGGNVGLLLAALHGDRVGRVVSLAGMAGGHNTIVPKMYEMLNPDRSLSLGQTMALLFPAEGPDFRKVVGQYLKAVASMPGAVTASSVGSKAALEQWAADQEFIFKDDQVWEALPSVRTPVLILNGEQDILVPPENAQRIHERIPGSQLHLFPGWGHAYKDPAQLAEVVTAWLLQQEHPAGLPLEQQQCSPE
ncbi:hypothetical protein N2152v2_008067 [Parachlorella kessleri]